MIQLTIQKLRSWRPSEEQRKAAELVFLQKAAVETIRPIVTRYQREILARNRFHIAKHWVEMGDEDKIILDPKEDYMLEDSDFQVYLAECRVEQKKTGLFTESPDFCPLLVAENLLIQAEHVLIDSFEILTGVKGADLWKLDHRKRYLDLLLSMMAQYMDKDKILKSVR